MNTQFASKDKQDVVVKHIGQLRITNATYQVPRSLAFWFLRRRLLKGFYIYGHGGHLGHVIKNIKYKFWLIYHKECSGEI